MEGTEIEDVLYIRGATVEPSSPLERIGWNYEIEILMLDEREKRGTILDIDFISNENLIKRNLFVIRKMDEF